MLHGRVVRRRRHLVMATRRRHPASRNPSAKVVSARHQCRSPSMRTEEDDELGEGWPAEQLLDKKIVSEEDKKQPGCHWDLGTVLYLVA